MQHQRQHDHRHDHPAAPMVDEITDFEVLEIAVRELAIEKGLFTAEDHRKFTEWAESIGPAGGSRLAAKAWTDPGFLARVRADATTACKEIGIDWAEPTGFGSPSDYMHCVVLEDTPTLHHDRLHFVLVLSAAAARPFALLVPLPQLSSPDRPLAASGAGGIRVGPAARGRDSGRGLQPEMPLYGAPRETRWHRELDRGAAGGNRDARLHDRRCLAAARPEVR